MRHHRLHQPLPQPGATHLLRHKDVAEPGEAGAVGNHPGEADRLAFTKRAEADAVLDGAVEDRSRDPSAPVGLAGQPAIDQVQVKPLEVGCDLEPQVRADG